MNVPLYLLLLLALLLGAWLTWAAVRRPDRRRLAGRILASGLAVAALVLLLRPPQLTRSYSATEAVLLTQGYVPDSIQALLHRLQPKPQVFRFGVTGGSAAEITDFAAFRQEHPRVHTLHVLGYGLPAEELAALDSLHLVPHLSSLPAGPLAASWPQEITLGEELQVQGTFGAAEKATWLYLQAAGRNRDSVQIKKGQAQTFSFRFKPKTTGRFTYALAWKNGTDPLTQEQLPFTVLPPRVLHVLVLSSAPSFEVKFLKNALARQGHSVAVRSQVSKALYQTEYANLPALSLARLTPALLQKFDVVLQDEGALQSLSASEKQALQQAVRQQGLGILTSFSGKPTKAAPFFAEAGFRQISQKQAKNVSLNWTGGKAALEVPPVLLTPGAQGQPLVWEQTPTQAVAVQYRKGAGQVGVSLVTETFPLALGGDSLAYQQYWATLLTALAKPQEARARVQLASLLPPSAGQPLTFTSAPQPVQAFYRLADDTLPTEALASPSGLLPGSFTSQVPALKEGWYQIQTASDSAGSIYVHGEKAWQTLKLQQQQQALLRSVKAHSAALAGDFPLQESMPQWPFFLLFVLSTGFLWLEEKL